MGPLAAKPIAGPLAEAWKSTERTVRLFSDESQQPTRRPLELLWRVGPSYRLVNTYVTWALSGHMEMFAPIYKKV